MQSVRTVRLLVLVVVFLFCALGATAQTQWVAHRSHGGSPETFSPNAGEAGLGLPAEPILRRVVRLSDSTAALHYAYPHRVDTVLRHAQFCNPAISVEKLQELYPNTTFEGYDTAEPRRRQRNGFPVAFDSPASGGGAGWGWVGLALAGFCLLAVGIYAFNRRQLAATS
jgi:hypothetical protein